MKGRRGRLPDLGPLLPWLVLCVGGEQESDDEDEGLDVDPILDQQSVRHEGGVNRLRCMPQVQQTCT